jgi:hypothetical protein
MINVGSNPPSWFVFLSIFIRTPREMHCQVTYTKSGMTLKNNFFIIHLLGPKIFIPYQVYFYREPFAKIHINTYSSIGADAIVFCFWASKKKPSQSVTNDMERG